MPIDDEVNQLKEQVKKLQLMLAKTGGQVLELQLANRKQGINDIQSKTNDLHHMVPASKPADFHSSDYVVESDLNDMVSELQTQLDLLDRRNMRRVLNSRSKNKLRALPNADGEEHPQFPKTIEELTKLTDAQLFEQWNHFEMLPNGETLEDLLVPNDQVGNQKVMLEIYESLLENVGVDPEEHPRSK